MSAWTRKLRATTSFKRGLRGHLAAQAVAALVCLAPVAAHAEDIAVGQLIDFSGPSAGAGVTYGVGVIDAVRYINAHGGINGTSIALATEDYGYQAPRAIPIYKSWIQGGKTVAIFGWGTADAEALVQFVTKDRIPYISAAYAASLSDPRGKGVGGRAAPYNFFYGPTYSDMARAMLTWAASDAKSKNLGRKPRYVHLGANHPYSNSPKPSGEEFARELGFDVLPAVEYSVTPGDFTAQCLTLKELEADYAYLGNNLGSTVALLKSCEAVGVKTTFLSSVWGMDENGLRVAGKAADGVIIPVRTAAIWTDEAVPAVNLLKDIAAGSGKPGYRGLAYIAGVCTAYYLKEALQDAQSQGAISGDAIRDAMEARANWVPAGLEGVCFPSTWTHDDHRGTTRVAIYRAHVRGATDGEVDTLVKDGVISLEKLTDVTVERRPEWLAK